MKKALMTLYYSFIYPYLTYFNHIWGSTYQTNLMKLQKLQNRIIKIICNAKRRDLVRPLYKATGLLQLGDINKYLICRFMFRVCNNHVSCVFHSFFKRDREFHNYETRTANHFHVPPVRTDLAKTGIRYRGATLWNAISNHGLDHQKPYLSNFSRKLLMHCHDNSYEILLIFTIDNDDHHNFKPPETFYMIPM